YHLFWNNQDANENVLSDEMTLLLDRFARPRREKLGDLWRNRGTYLMSEYEYEYGALHAPYTKWSKPWPRTEILHPLFVERQHAATLKIGHLTDMHCDVRVDVYEENLKREKVKASYNNWNASFARLYADARQDS